MCELSSIGAAIQPILQLSAVTAPSSAIGRRKIPHTTWTGQCVWASMFVWICVCSRQSAHYCVRIVPNAEKWVSSIHNNIGHLPQRPLFVTEKSLKILTGIVRVCVVYAKLAVYSFFHTVILSCFEFGWYFWAGWSHFRILCIVCGYFGSVLPNNLWSVSSTCA